MERFPDLGTYVRRGAAAALLMLAACTPNGRHPAENAARPTPTSISAADSCKTYGHHNALQPFDGQRFFEAEPPYTALLDASDALYAQHPAAKPEEFANLYLQTRSQELGAHNISVALDPSLGLTDWEPTEGQYAESENRRQRTNLIRDLSDIIDVVNDYPPGMLAKLNVKTIRLADTHLSPLIGGHYNTASDEIQVEYNTKEPDHLSGSLRETIAHEVGHSVHDEWCGGFDSEDQELAGSIDFIGRLPESMSDEGQLARYEKVTNKDYADGSRRIFPRAYAATSVQEYFACIVEFTIETRGLILPGDKDYNSPLYHNQRMIVDRAEKLFPGFNDFATRMTQLLRTNPKNEIYDDIEHVNVTHTELDKIASPLVSEDPLVLNGVFMDDNYAGPSYSGRGGNLTIYPRVTRDLQGLKVWVEDFEEKGASYTGGRYLNLNQTRGSQAIRIFKLPGAPLFAPQSQADKTYQAHSLTLRHEVWAGDSQAASFLAQIQAEGAKLVEVEFVG